MRKYIFIVLVVILVTNLLLRVYQYRTYYSQPFDASYWQQRYDNSQWSTKAVCDNPNPHVNPYTCVWDDQWYAKHQYDTEAQYLKKSPIGDDGLYTYAGWVYIHGHDPTTLNAEVPPFGKYLIGLSEIIFINQNIFALVSTLLILIAFYLLNTVLFKDKLLAFTPIVLFSFDPLFYSQLRTTLLDALYLDLLLFLFNFFLKKQYFISAIFLGLMAATKSSQTTFILVISVEIVYLLITKQKDAVKKYILSLAVALGVFLLTYAQYFLHGHTLREFLGVQKWIYIYYSTGAKGSFITPWEMIAIGKWHTWWGTYIPFYRWHIGWWAFMILTPIAVYLMIRTRYIKPMILLVIWIFFYMLFLSFIPTWPRYLLLVLPFLYNLAIWVLTQESIKRRILKIKIIKKSI